jgi:TM2 domain-containing membrane protein YozV
MIEEKNQMTALILSFFFGTLGFDRFYLGCTATGFLKLITLGGLGIWALVDFIRIATGSRLCGGFTWDDKVHKASDNKYIKTDFIFIFVSLAIAGVLLYFTIEKIKKMYHNYFYNNKETQYTQHPLKL